MNKTSLMALAAIPLFFGSCIQDEPENIECDIESISLHLENPRSFFRNIKDTTLMVGEDRASNELAFLIKSFAHIQSAPTTLHITPGATVYMETESGEFVPFLNGTSIDFSDEQAHRFRVVSEDKAWSRIYSVSVKHRPEASAYLSEEFDNYALDSKGKYYIWDAPSIFIDETGNSTWKNGNPGYAMSKSSALPMDYPSTPVADGGPDGSPCVKLETCDTGPFGKMANMRLASGSMFNGIFDVGNAIKDPLGATQFGSPFTFKPEILRIWLRYEPGSVYQDRDGKAIDGVIDEPDVYVVLFRNEDAEGNKVQPDGNDMLTNPYIIGKGRLPHNFDANGNDLISGNPIHGITSEWQEFTIPIEYTTEPDPDILEDEGYSVIISIASSWQGGYFKGAIGSKLYVDKLQLFCEERETDNEQQTSGQ